MAGGVTLVYLDIDDEITSAAARIRAAEEVRVALVVPSGSRLATSRINFRLLAREAQGRSRQLLIVAPDGATRSLAASAGLTVYPTVRDLEAAFAPPPTSGSESGGGPAGDVPGRGRSGSSGAAGSGSAGTTGSAGTAGAGSAAGKPGTTDTTELAGLAGAAGAAGRDRPLPDAEPTRVIPPDRLPMARPIRDDSGPSQEPYDPGRGAGRGGAPSLPVVHGGDRRGGTRRFALLAGGVFLILIALVVGVLGYVFLPAATIVVTPKVEPIALTFNVTADPSQTASDVANSVVPASVETFPLDATAEFPATGKKVTNTKASGTVTFSSLDPARSNTIPAGSIVSTTGDVEFATTNAVHLPPATLVSDGSGGFRVVPTTGDSKIVAVKGGPDGNVDAGTIRVVPSGENGVTTKVTNRDPTTGGTHTEALQVSQKDIDGATATLAKQLSDQLDATVANPSQVLPGSTVFPETKSMTAPIPTVDPTTLVGQIVDSFSYDLTATGRVTAVDETAVNDVATARLLSSVGADRALVKDSLSVTVGAGRPANGLIVFPVRANASQVRTVVATDLIPAVRGRTVAEARAILGAYGDVTIDLWPGFSDRIPMYDFRIDLVVRQDIPLESPGPSLPGATPRPTIRAATPPPASTGSPGPSATTKAPAKTPVASPSP